MYKNDNSSKSTVDDLDLATQGQFISDNNNHFDQSLEELHEFSETYTVDSAFLENESLIPKIIIAVCIITLALFHIIDVKSGSTVKATSIDNGIVTTQ